MEIKKIYLIEEIDSEIHNICFTSKEAAVDYIRGIVEAEIDNIMNNEEIYIFYCFRDIPYCRIKCSIL